MKVSREKNSMKKRGTNLGKVKETGKSAQPPSVRTEARLENGIEEIVKEDKRF